MEVRLPAIFLLLLFLTNYRGRAQNLVTNGNFETAYKNPCLYIFDPKVTLGDFFPNWSTPTRGTSDPWYHSDTVDVNCSQNLKQIGVSAYSGTRCVGIYMSANNARYIKNSPNYREYLQTRLKSPLQPGKTYSVELHCRRHPWSGTNANNLGFLFSTKAVSANSDSVLKHIPQVNIAQVIEADNGWITLGGCFVADSAYSYLTIGNFFDEGSTRLVIAPLPNRDERPYYLLDDIAVQETSVEKLPKSAFLGRDTTLCPQQSLTLRLPTVLGITYRWSDGSALPNYTVSQSGSYSVVAQLDQCVVKDTIKVQLEQAIRLTADTSLCNETPFVIKPSRSDPRLVWSDGSTDSTLTVSQTGSYFVRVPSPYCLLADTVHVEFLHCNPFVPNVFTPNGDGKNDYFVVDPDNAQRLSWDLEIVNRWGRLVYKVSSYQNDWTGKDLPAGIYYYSLSNYQYNRLIKGWVQIYR